MFRLGYFTAVALVILGAIGFIAPVQLPVILYKLGLVTLAAVLGYWLDRHLFPYARPHVMPVTEYQQGVRMIRRAIIVSAAMVAFALAL